MADFILDLSFYLFIQNFNGVENNTYLFLTVFC